MTNQVAELAIEDPGELYNQALHAMARHMGGREGAEISTAEAARQWLTYVNHYVDNRAQLKPESKQRLRMLAQALNALGSGKLPQTADILTQWFKSEELAAAGHQDASSAVLLNSLTDTGLVTARELQAANRFATARSRLVGRDAPNR